MIAFLKTIYSNNKVLIISFLVSVSCYSIYVIFRGFGWDGDSFISASQYQKLVSSDLYGIIDGGAHPKMLSVLLFGMVYQLSGGFYLLTILAILLNILMIITITSWINQEKGIWLIALIGILINIPWTKIVVNCDNPAFSTPFLIFGLYYISKNRFIEGSTLLIISSLFRSGTEFIIIFVLFKQLFNKNLKNTIILGIAFIISAIHTYWGYLLIYPIRELFWELSWKFLTTPESIAEYQYSINAFIPYINSVMKQLFNKYSILFIIPAIWGTFIIFRRRTIIKFALLIPLASLILPISSFMYGVRHIILETKHMGFTILLPVLAAFSINCSILEKVGSKTKVFITTGVLLLVILFSAFTGNLKQGDYEAHVNGTGVIGWTNFPDIKHDVQSVFLSDKINVLTAYQYLTFIILDIGKYAYNIDVIRDTIEFDYTAINKYDLIVVPKAWSIDSKILSNFGYTIKSINNNSYIYYISTPKFPNN